MVEAIYGCKWSLTVYQLLANGINRPGAMVRNVEGLTTKVLNECLRKNTEFPWCAGIAWGSPRFAKYLMDMTAELQVSLARAA